MIGPDGQNVNLLKVSSHNVKLVRLEAGYRWSPCLTSKVVSFSLFERTQSKTWRIFREIKGERAEHAASPPFSHLLQTKCWTFSFSSPQTRSPRTVEDLLVNPPEKACGATFSWLLTVGAGITSKFSPKPNTTNVSTAGGEFVATDEAFERMLSTNKFSATVM